MAEDQETATARYIAGNVSTQLMLKGIIEIISTMADDPDNYRASLKTKVLELAGTMPRWRRWTRRGKTRCVRTCWRQSTNC
jgi:hypothetical protein